VAFIDAHAAIVGSFELTCQYQRKASRQLDKMETGNTRKGYAKGSVMQGLSSVTNHRDWKKAK